MSLFGRGNNKKDAPSESVGATSDLEEPEDVAVPVTSRRGRVFASFQYRDYRYLWVSQFGWSGAMWMEQVARNWLVWQLTGSSLSVGLILLFQGIPRLFLALPGGVVADRFNQKYVMMASQSLTMAGYIISFLLVWTGSVEVWHLYVLSLARGVSMSFTQPARQTLISRLVPSDRMLNAFALNQIANNSNRLLAPAVAGLLIGFYDVTAAFGTAVIIFSITIVSTAMVRSSSAKSMNARQSAKGQLIEGINYVLNHRGILLLMSVAFAMFTFVLPYNALMPMIADQVLGIGPAGFGVLLSLGGVGALAGGLILASVGDVQSKGLLFLGGSFAFAISIFLLGIAPWASLAFVIMPFIGASQSIFFTAGNTALLSQAPPELRGRVLSVYNLDRGLQPAGSGLAGGMADLLSAPTTLMIMGGIGAVLVLGISIFAPTLRKLR